VTNKAPDPPDSSPDGADARQHPRARARIKVEYQYGTTTGVGHTTDISEGGIFLSSRRLAAPGTRVYLRMYLPGEDVDDPLKVIGEVVRVVRPAAIPSGSHGGREPESKAGMGIQYEVAYARTRETLGGFVGRLLTGPSEKPPPISPIKPVPGASEGGAKFAVRFGAKDKDDKKEPKKDLTAEQVDRLFAFKTTVDWSRVWSISWKASLVLLLLFIVGYVLVRVVGFTGAYG